LAYNMIFVASVSTLLFNANPLLRYDGYYIFADLLDMPNLHQQASEQLQYWVERYAFKCPDAQNPSTTRKEACWLTAFGIFSGVYRVFVFSVVLFFVADRFFLLGMLMAVVCAAAWVIVPCVQFVKYLAESPRLYRTRSRAIAVCGGALALAVLLLGVCPFPFSF